MYTCWMRMGSQWHAPVSYTHLKKRICDVLKVDMLPSDFYAVFKNITKYSIWELTELLKLNNLTDTEEDIQILNSKRKVLSENNFKKHKKEFIIRHKENYGIPQDVYKRQGMGQEAFSGRTAKAKNGGNA